MTDRLQLRPHDLVRVGAGSVGADAPAWARAAAERAPWAVVRRARAERGWIAVGIRGDGRHQRHATRLRPQAVEQVVRPEQLAAAPPEPTDLPALRTLVAVAPALASLALTWGPAGAVGFQLATSTRVVRASSDLDLVVRVPGRPDTTTLALLRAAFDASPCRVDCLLELPAGAVHLDEVHPDRPALMRTADGPVLLGAGWT